MPGNIYLMRDEGPVVMSERPYDSEALLQKLLAEHPALLAGEQMIDGSPRRWLLVSREVPLSIAEGAPSWFVDHLFLDQEGVPTLVEAKRSSDSRIRREVVGQMLDYAANAVVRWPVEQLRAAFLGSLDAEARLEAFLDSSEVEAFWASVKANLERGRIRMVFVADEIPPELRRIVEFLAAQMRNAEVFAVEVRNFEGAGERALVPRLVSAPKTAAANDAAPERQWEEQSFFEELERQAARCVPVARALWEWGKRAAGGFWYGKGSKRGSCYPEFFVGGKKTWLFAMRTDGTLEVQFIYLKSFPPFDAEEKRRELAERLNSIPGVSIAAERISARPSFEMLALAEENAMARFLAVMDWVIGEVRRP